MENRIISLEDSPEPPRNVSMRDGGLVVHVGGKNDAEKMLTKAKMKLNNSKTFRMVFCHLEFLRSSASPDLHLTQLAADPFPARPDHLSFFLPVAPPVLAEYLDHYKVGGDLMQTLTMTREGSETFLFRPPILVEEVQRVVCVPESEALRIFLDFLEIIGPNIILVGLDEDSVGVLMQKLKESNRARFLKQVEGYTWWRRILKYSSCRDYKDLSLEEFYQSTFSPPPGALLTCSLVAERLKQAVKEVACRQGFMAVSGGKFVSAVAVPVQARPRLEEREVREGLEVLEVVNSYLSIPVTSFAVSRMEQVDIDHDEESVDASKKKSDVSGRAVKQEQNEEAFSIYISSDSETEDVAKSLAPGPILHEGGTDLEPWTQDLTSTSETAPVPTTFSTVEDTASTRTSDWSETYRIPKSSSVGTNSYLPPSSLDQTTAPPTTTQRRSLVAGPGLLNTGGFPQPPAAIAGLKLPPESDPTPSSQCDIQFGAPPTTLGPSLLRPPPTILGPPQMKPRPMLGPSQIRPLPVMIGPAFLRPPPTVLGLSQVRPPPTILGPSQVRPPPIMLGPSQLRPSATILGPSQLRPCNSQAGPLTDLQLRVAAECDPPLLVPASTSLPPYLPAGSCAGLNNNNNNSSATLSSMAPKGSKYVMATSKTVSFCTTTSHPVRKNLVLLPQKSATPITGQKTAPLISRLKRRSLYHSSGWRIVDTSHGGKMVICPVYQCQTKVDLQPTKVCGDAEKWTLLEEHMREHEEERLFWSRPCLVCVDRGDLFTTVAPEWLRTHVLSDHQVNGPFSSAPPSQPSVKSTGNMPVNVPQPVQTKQVGQPGSDPAPDVKFWKFVETFRPEDDRKACRRLFVVCPSCPLTLKTHLNPKNVVSHLKRIHKITSPVQLCDKKCQGCKAVVPPDQLVKHIASCIACHIACQQTTTTNEATLKRKAPVDAKPGKKKTLDEKFGKYMAIQGSSSSVKGPLIRVVRDHGSN